MLLKTSGDPLRVSTRALTSSAILATPPTLVVWNLSGRPSPPSGVWILVAASCLLELGYFVALSAAYRRGELSLVYPVARGTAALLAVPTGFVILGERLTVFQALGVAFLLAGIFLLRRPFVGGSALVPALLTGGFIAGYQALDRVAVRLVSPWFYGWLIWVGTAALLLLWVRFANPRGDPPSSDPGWPASVMLGVLMTAAYLMVLVAYSIAPLALVAPLRESAIVLVTAWGMWKLREGGDLFARLAGVAAVVVGVTCIALGHAR